MVGKDFERISCSGKNRCLNPFNNCLSMSIFVFKDFASFSSFDDWDDGEGISGRNANISSTDGEDSDTEFLVIPTTEVDLPHNISSHLDRSDAVTAAAFQFARLRRKRKRVG